jgi:hypothetical protein
MSVAVYAPARAAFKRVSVWVWRLSHPSAICVVLAVLLSMPDILDELEINSPVVLLNLVTTLSDVLYVSINSPYLLRCQDILLPN